METNKQNRFKSWALWLSILGALSVILSAFGVWEKLGLTSEGVETIITAIGSVLTAFGIVNNPTSSDTI